MAEITPSQVMLGMNLDGSVSQLKKGETTYALNATVQNFDGNQINYQNEEANILCNNLPENSKIVGKKQIPEKNLFVVFLSLPGNSEIGVIENCTYREILKSPCLDFNINTPVHDIVHRLSNEGDIEIYWAQKKSKVKYLNLGKLPYISNIENCNDIVANEIDCNKLLIFPSVKFPRLEVKDVISGGNVIEGSYQYGIQFANQNGEPYTSIYYVSSTVSVKNDNVLSQNFDENTGKSILLSIFDLDTSGVYEYINLIVVKKINNTPTPELVGTYRISGSSFEVVYSGQSRAINISPDELFERFERYETAGGITSVGDILVFYDVETKKRINFQKIWSKVSLKWESVRLPKELSYADGVINNKYKGYYRDEVYAFEGAFIYNNGTTSDYFHIPGRAITSFDKEIITNEDGANLENCDTEVSNERWKIYNTANVLTTNELTKTPCIPETYQKGEFAYFESTDKYPCNKEIWGDLSDTYIRHHKFPDCLISPIHDDEGGIYPLGINVDIVQLRNLIDASDLNVEDKQNIIGISLARANRVADKTIVAKGLLYNVGEYEKNNQKFLFPNYPYNDLNPDVFLRSIQSDDDSGYNPGSRLEAFKTEDSKKKYTFHSPDTHFFQPSLGSVLKIETVENGKSLGQFVQVEKHSKYKVATTGAYATLLGALIAATSLKIVQWNVTGLGTGGSLYLPQGLPDVFAALTAYTAFKETIENTLPRINYAYQYNSVGDYNKSIPVQNTGSKVRNIDSIKYITSGFETTDDGRYLNNLHRESSVYVSLNNTLPFPHQVGGIVDDSRWSPNCDNFDKIETKNISSYYAAIKNPILNPYGRLYSYESISLGEVCIFKNNVNNFTFFGGDVFISKFAFKRKLSFFTQNRVNFPDEADVDYRDVNNIAYPNYWFSTDAKAGDTLSGVADIFGVIFGTKANNLSCAGSKVFYQTGKFYLFAYGIPYFYCESEVNVDLRNATNNAAGDFYPNVGTGIPHQWLQEATVSIVNDNVYSYNKTFSSQNKENFIQHLPEDFNPLVDEVEYFPNRSFYSEKQENITSFSRNNWLIYKPLSLFDFPLNYGKLTSLTGIANSQVLARFESKSMLYNAMLTVGTSTPKAAFIGNETLFKSAPPLDFKETDFGFNGSQNKFILKTDYGVVSIDAKRKQIILFAGKDMEELSSDKYKCNSFFRQHLSFKILEHLPNVDVDNPFKNIGILGVYDSKYKRLIITKLDYVPKSNEIEYVDSEFRFRGDVVDVKDTNYFINKSFTISFSFLTMSWISYHTYTPNVYIPWGNEFFSSNNNGEIWKHNSEFAKFNNFYGEIHPYIIEYPIPYIQEDVQLQNIKDYTKALSYISEKEHVVLKDAFFNKAILYNDEQCTGMLHLNPKKRNDMSSYLKYPKYTVDGKHIQYVRHDNFYQYNTLYNVVKNTEQPFFTSSSQSLSFDKELILSNLDYTNNVFKKTTLNGRSIKVRHILDNSSDYKLISEFILVENEKN